MHPRNATGFEWDERNGIELGRHRITEDEAEQVFWNAAAWPRNKKHRSGEWKMIGCTDGGRQLTIVVLCVPGTGFLRCITGWDSTDGERTRYLR